MAECRGSYRTHPSNRFVRGLSKGNLELAATTFVHYPYPKYQCNQHFFDVRDGSLSLSFQLGTTIGSSSYPGLFTKLLIKFVRRFLKRRYGYLAENAPHPNPG